MKWIDILSWSMNNLRQRKLRSALTMLGVVIGTLAIVVTMSLGYGAEETQMAMLENMVNLRMIQVNPSYGRSSTDKPNAKRITKITDSVVSSIRRIKNITAVTPLVYVYPGYDSVFMTGKYEANSMILAVSPGDFMRMYGIKQGRGFSTSTNSMEFMMAEGMMAEFRDPKKDDYDYYDVWEYLKAGEEPPLPKIDWMNAGYTFQLRWEDYENTDANGDPLQHTKDVKAKMVGVLDLNPEDSDVWTFGYSGIININWLRKFQRENKVLYKELGMPDLNDYSIVYVLANTVDDVEQVVADLTDMGLQPYNQLVVAQQMKAQIATVQGFLAFIGAVSMAVAALMIANTMMMSIYERTREIGVMKVLGCRMTNIRAMFLAEAAYIGIFGGLFGLVLSYAASYALNNVDALQALVSSVMSSVEGAGGGEGRTSIIPLGLALGTWAGVIVISILSGLYPAQRAMRLSSLAAIRNAD